MAWVPGFSGPQMTLSQVPQPRASVNVSVKLFVGTLGGWVTAKHMGVGEQEDYSFRGFRYQ